MKNEVSYLSQTIETQLNDLKDRALNSSSQAKINKKYSNVFLGLIFFIGAFTPLIVIFRKMPFIPVQFWVYWCIATPLLSSVLTYMMSYFDWEGKSSSYNKETQLLQVLQDRAKLKFATATPETMPSVFEWLLEEKSKIEAILS